jgi:hypothetical protein
MVRIVPAIGGITATIDNVETRAVLAQGTTLRILAYQRSGTNANITNDVLVSEQTYTVSADGTLTADGGKGMFLIPKQTYDFYLVTPALTVTNGTVSVPHNVDYATAAVPAQKVEAGSIEAGGAWTLYANLTRQMAKLNITVDRQDAGVTSVASGGLVTLTAMAPSPVTVQPGGTLSAAAGSTTFSYNGATFTAGANAWQGTYTTYVLPKTAGTFTVGFKLRVNGKSKLNDYTATLNTGNIGALEAGKEYNLTLNIPTPVVVPTEPGDLSAENTANCYILNDANESYHFNATIMGNGTVPASQQGKLSGTIPKSANYTAKILWSMGGSGGENGVIGTPVYDSSAGTISFTTTNQSANGNALVALVDSKGTGDTSDDVILWSWHLWRTSYDPSTDYHLYDVIDGRTLQPTWNAGKAANETYTRFMVNQENGEPGMKVMKYDLGAVNLGAIISNDETNGLFYAWGRKDPFWGAGYTNSSYYGGSAFAPYEITDVASTIQKPMNFIGEDMDMVTDFDPDHWGDPGESAPRLARDEYNGAAATTFAITMNPKTCFDPCPTGWRVSPAETFKIFDSYNQGQPQTQTQNAYGAGFQVNSKGTLANFSTQGCIGSPDLLAAGWDGTNWTSGVIGNQPEKDSIIEAFFFATSPGSNNYPKMYNCDFVTGFRVRCVQE